MGSRESRCAYLWFGNVYLNITNRCPTSCAFCVKKTWLWTYCGNNLMLRHEPDTDEIWTELEQLAVRHHPSEIVFCGYGEPTYRLEAIAMLSGKIRERFPGVRIRLNTVGLGSLIHGLDIVPALRLHVDAVSISVNTADPRQWLTLHQPHKSYGNAGLDAVCRFASGCVQAGLHTTLTAVNLPEVDLPAVERLAHKLGAEFRSRPSLTSVA
jgi:TatD family-associated radical SAM protein